MFLNNIIATLNASMKMQCYTLVPFMCVATKLVIVWWTKRRDLDYINSYKQPRTSSMQMR